MKRVQIAVDSIKDDVTGKNLLEVACGCAEFSICAARTANHVTCIDLESHRLNPEIGIYSNILFQKIDATNMQYKGNTFDTIVLYNAVGHLSEIIDPVLQECKRILKKNGKIYMINSFKMDKQMMEDKLYSFLEEKKIPFSILEDKYYRYVKR